MSTNLAAGIEKAYSEHQDFLLMALTGRTGSGCTTAATLLSKNFPDIPFNYSDVDEPEGRKLRILGAFAKERWVPFKRISVSTLIFSFLAEKPWGCVATFLESYGLDSNVLSDLQELWSKLAAAETVREFYEVAKKTRDANAQALLGYTDYLVPASDQVRAKLAGKYHQIFQAVGDNLRLSGDPLSDKFDPEQIFALSIRICALIRCHRKVDKIQKIPTRIVIDAIRNPLELVYLRDRFTPFYVVAITTEDEERKSRLRALNYSDDQIGVLDEKEYSVKQKFLDGEKSLVSQSIQNCIQKADIFIGNAGGAGSSVSHQTKPLALKLVRYATLAIHPGLVTPTRDERCMQIAFVTKLNSGCISRQVGAVVADKSYSIKAVGWNDVAKGQVPCLLRDVGSLQRGDDDYAFSDYELKNEPFKEKVLSDYEDRSKLNSVGLPCPYCFKDAYNDREGKAEKNQVHTRSLHAEENAFLQLAKFGNSAIEKGYLYTTASPCELCSKKAYQLGIKEVIYVDPYPGISINHVLGVGSIENRPELRLFSGAVGNAYHRLYESLLPVKDEFAARRLGGSVSGEKK